MKIGIFSGTFDPFTAAHREIANEVVRKHVVDKLYIVPTVVTYYRENYSPWLDDEGRVKCCNEMMRHSPYYENEIEILDIEIKAKLTSGDENNFVKNRRYVDTLRNIMSYADSKYIHDKDLYTIIGSDQFENFKSWYHYSDIAKMSKLIVINGRNGKIVESSIPHEDILIDESFSFVSASEIRNRFSGLELYDYLSWVEQNACGDNKRVFVSGPMTGYENYNIDAFRSAAKLLKENGYHPVDPTLISGKYPAKEIQKMGDIYDQMVEDQLQSLESCSAIYLLKGWENSKGAKKELQCALDCGLRIMLEK